MVMIPGYSSGQDVAKFMRGPSLAVTGDAGGHSSCPQSPAQIKGEEAISVADSDSHTESDSAGMPSDRDQARRATRRRLSVSSIRAQTIVDIQRSLHFSVDRLKQHWSGFSGIDQHLAGVNNSIQELENITNILESVLGQSIQSSEHRERDSSISRNLRSQPSLHTHTQDQMFPLVHLHEAAVTDDRDGVAQRETNQTAFTDQDDEEVLYGRYVVAAMKKLTDRSRSEAKLKIQQVIFTLQVADG